MTKPIRLAEPKRKRPAIKRSEKKTECANCERPVEDGARKNNAGYCNECAFEAWGEEEPS